MKKTTEWESQIDGKNYSFSHEKKKGKHLLTINGTPEEIKGGFMSSALGFDEGIKIDGKEARFVFERNQPDVVVDNKYLQSGKAYVKRPAWVLAFAVACILIPVAAIGGAIPAVLGFSGAALCVSVSKAHLPVGVRLLLCALITVSAWGLLFLLGMGAALLG